MADQPRRHGFGLLGVGAAACAACCAGPIIASLAAASVATFIGIALFGVVGPAVAAIVVVAVLRRQALRQKSTPAGVPVTLGRKPDA